jgi:hypothetical protein
VGQYETEAKKLKQEVEKLLEHLTKIHQQERMAQLHEMAESQADRQTLKREQEEPVQLQQSIFPPDSLHSVWEEGIHPERPEELRQQGWNGKQNHKRAAVPSALEAPLRE